MNNPLVSVVIPTHNRKKSAERLIKSILRSTYKNLEIIVIDDASDDNTYEYLKNVFKDKKIKIFRNKKNLFTGGTRNVGQKLSKGKYILFIDDDNVVGKDMIKELVSAFDKNENVGEVGPINYSYRKKSKVFWTKTVRNMWTTKTYHVTKIPPRVKYWETPDVPNAFMVKANIVEKNNITFNSDYGIMYEESDYAYRIRNLGYKILVARNAIIYHDIEEYSKNGKTKDYMYHFMKDERRPFVFARNRVIFHKKFSNKLQLIGIVVFWIWFFNLYYIYKFLSYKGYGDFSLSQKTSRAYAYTKGNIHSLIGV